MTVPANRARMLGAALAAVTAAALAALASGAYAQTAAPAGVFMTPSPGPTEPPPPPPTLTPSPSEPAESCTIEPSPSPFPSLAPDRAGTDAGPVTCSNRHSIITVSWDGTNLKVVIKPNPDFGGGRLTCTLDPKSVKVTQPNNATVDKDGVVTVPYDKDKKVKITIKIEYDINCVNGNITVPLRDVVTIEFTPPDGPIVVTNRSR